MPKCGDVVKTVLFVTYHFPPSAASGTQRILGFTEHLPALDWSIDVVTPDRVPLEPIDQGLIQRVPAGVRTIQVKYPTGGLSRIGRRFVGHSVWLPRLPRTLARLIAQRRPDVVVTSGPPQCVHLAGLYCKLMYGIPWVADFRDPWVAGAGLKVGLFGGRLSALGERWVFARADGIVVNAPNAGKIVAAHYPAAAEKIHCVTNGYDPSQFSGIEAAPRSQFVITHAGEIYAGRDPRPFLDAIKILLAEEAVPRERLSVEFIGTGEDSGLSITEEIAQRGLANVVRVVGRVPYRESLARMVNSDLLLLLDAPNRLGGVPAKLYEYIGARRPIIALATPSSDVDWVLRESRHVFRLAPTHDVPGICSALRDLLSDPGQVTLSTAPDLFSRRVLAGRFSQLLTSLIRPQARSNAFTAMPAVEG